MSSTGVSQALESESSVEFLLRRYCVLPDPIRSFEEAERRGHSDLEALPIDALMQERAMLRFWLELNPSIHPWFLERLERVEARLCCVR